MNSSLWQKILAFGAFLFGASLGVALVCAFAWSFLILVGQHYYNFESASYGASGFDIVELISIFSAFVIGLAGGLGGIKIFGKIYESKRHWLYSLLCLCGYVLMANIYFAIQIYFSVSSNSGP